ncbi:SusC/RagA family TonB-linked outer membrane protein [Pedobacter sp. ASV28]|uniref:SusC/RagA family TonB-linked outer membrane protein n=1 Tax=Pedobacter sp. ASV28 TaxID=2795123 RepID=UPI001E367168|nr:SusC/RagA family TonB-linked outer membrane protein [Pedobacter sp. ASV28]
MKLVTVILFTSLLQVSAASFGQRLTLNEKNITIEKMVKEIRKQAGYDVLLSTNKIKSTSRIDANFNNATITEVMEKILAGKNLTYSIEDKTILIKPKEKSMLDKIIDYFVDIKVTGKVKDKEGQAVPGVSVIIKGTTTVVVTNDKGEYQLSVPEGATLIYRYIGYKSVEMPVEGRTRIDVSLEEDASELKEVNIVSTGFQNINKKLFTGAATSIKGSDVKQDGVTDISRMLEGKVAGVSVQNVSGTFGAAPKIRVRGATSISGENKPLWVIDGIVLEDIVNISNDQLSSGDALTLIGSSVAGLNADDIEDFSILKDASATALYGARAMNGVVVITTKKGRAGNTKVNYSGNFSSFLKPSYDNYNIMNSADQMSVYAEVARKGGLTSSIVNGVSGGVYTKMWQLINTYNSETGQFAVENTPEGKSAFLKRYALANTDWFDILFKNSFVQEHSVSISSGSDKSTHYFSLGYYNDNGWSIGDNVKRYTMNLRGDYNISNKVSAGILAQGAFRQQRAPGTLGRTSNTVEGKYSRDFDINPFSYALNTSRTTTAYDQNGNLEYFKQNYAPFSIINELDNNYIDLDMLDLKVQGELNYKFIKDFNFKSIGAIRYVKTTREHKITEFSNMALAYRYAPNSTIAKINRFLYKDPETPEITDPIITLPEGGFYNRSDDNLLNFNVRNQVDYNHTFGKHQVRGFIGQEIKFSNRQNSWSNGYGYQYDKGGVPFTDYRIVKMLLQNNYDYFGMSQLYDRYAAFFLNGSYAYNQKYIINGTFRYDGSNRLGASKTARWLPTWTVSGAWNIDEEDFIKNISKISYMKVRAGYGLTASMGSASNSSIVLTNNKTLRPNLSEVEPRIVLSGLENSELTWEKQYEANVGLDAGLFNSRLTFSLDYYNRKGFDLIGNVRTSGIGGQYTKQANYADMKSHGFEVTIGGRIGGGNQNSLSWSPSFTFGYNKNKITNLQTTPRIYDLIIPEGGAMQGGAVRGLYSIDFQKLNGLGVPTFIDEEGEITSDVYVQSQVTKYLKYEGPVDPTVTGGLTNNFKYKNFQFTFFVSYQAGNKIRLNNVYSSSYSDSDAMPREFLDRWTLPLDENYTNAPSLADYLLKKDLSGTYPYTAYNYSTARVADGSFVRLKQVSVMYNLSNKLNKKLGLSNASIKLQGNNIWLIYADKKLKGQDPEFFTSGGVAMPIPQQLTLSLKVGI